MDVDGQEYTAVDMFSRKHLALPSSSGILILEQYIPD